MFNSKLTVINTKPVVLNTPTIINTNNLKFICELCGHLAPNMESLKVHLNSHNTNNNNNNVSRSGNGIGKKIDTPQCSSSVQNVNCNNSVGIHQSKISSIIASAKTSPINHNTNSLVINMPQSMTVFNLKEISSKLKTINNSNSRNNINNDSNDKAKISLLNKILSNSSPSSLSSSSSTASSPGSVSVPLEHATKTNNLEKISNSDTNSNVKSDIQINLIDNPKTDNSNPCETNQSFKSINNFKIESANSNETLDHLKSGGCNSIDKIEKSTSINRDNNTNIISLDKNEVAGSIDVNFSSKIVNSMPILKTDYKENILSATTTTTSPSSTLINSNTNSNNNNNITSSNSSSLPYHYSDYENLYICNLCNCTYDSLRSIKAHLWKHSGHHELSYPIHDYVRPIDLSAKQSISPNQSNTNSKNSRKSIKEIQSISPTGSNLVLESVCYFSLSESHLNQFNSQNDPSSNLVNELNEKSQLSLNSLNKLKSIKKEILNNHDEINHNLDAKLKINNESNKFEKNNLKNDSSLTNRNLFLPIKLTEINSDVSFTDLNNQSNNLMMVSQTSNTTSVNHSGSYLDANCNNTVSMVGNCVNGTIVGVGIGSGVNGSGGCGGGGSNGGGICSVLLEVIEKLRDEESSNADANLASIDSENPNSNPIEQKIDFSNSNELHNANINDASNLNNNNKKKLDSFSFRMKKTKLKRRKFYKPKKLKNSNANKSAINTNKMDDENGTSTTTTTTTYNNQIKNFNIKDEISTGTTPVDAVEEKIQKFECNNNNNNINDDEYEIETSIVNSLFDDDDAILTKDEEKNLFEIKNSFSSLNQNELNSNTQQQEEQEQSNQTINQTQNNLKYVCLNCYEKFNKKNLLNEHKKHSKLCSISKNNLKPISKKLKLNNKDRLTTTTINRKSSKIINKKNSFKKCLNNEKNKSTTEKKLELFLCEYCELNESSSSTTTKLKLLNNPFKSIKSLIAHYKTEHYKLDKCNDDDDDDESSVVSLINESTNKLVNLKKLAESTNVDSSSTMNSTIDVVNQRISSCFSTANSPNNSSCSAILGLSSTSSRSSSPCSNLILCSKSYSFKNQSNLNVDVNNQNDSFCTNSSYGTAVDILLNKIMNASNIQDLNNDKTNNNTSFNNDDETPCNLIMKHVKNFNVDLITLLNSLATNDGFEQYVCGLCSYVCYHLPSLKSHMWTHVKDEKFDYSVNTSIINAALDYENKLNRKLNLIKKNKLFSNGAKEANEYSIDENDEHLDSLSKNAFLERQLISALELLNYSQMDKISNFNFNKNTPMVAFRCSKCGFETIDLSILRLHKREHYVYTVSLNDSNTLQSPAAQIQKSIYQLLNNNANNNSNSNNQETISLTSSSSSS